MNVLHDDPHQTPAERAARLAPGGPVRTTVAWVHAVMDEGRLEAAWPLTDRSMRLALAQDWILEEGHRLLGPDGVGGRTRDDLAAALAARQPSGSEWAWFARARIRRWRELWGDLGVSPLWGVWGRPEPVGVDLEVVTLVRYEPGEARGEAVEVEAGAPRTALRFVMRAVADGGADLTQWRVAGLGGRLPEPGWPPTTIELGGTLRQC